jgi:simple sugar transport system permease protein
MNLPRLHLEPRERLPLWLRLARPALALAAAGALGAVFLALAGLDPWDAYGRLLAVGFGDRFALSDSAVKATPILLTALAAVLAFRARLWNIGAEGQLHLGAWAAAGVALHLLPAATPRPLMLAAMALAGFLAGAAWGAIPGWLKGRLGVNEIISTLMLNYIALQWVCFFVFGPWSEGGFQLTPAFPDSACLPRLSDWAGAWPALSGLTLHAGVLLGPLAALGLWWLLTRTRSGFELRVIGDNPRAAAYAGMDLARTSVWVLALSGALAGLAGMSEVAGVVHRLQDRFSPGFGFSGIIVAWLAGLNPWWAVAVAFLFGGLLVGGKAIQPAGVPQMLQGIILFVVVGSEFLARYRVRLRTAKPHVPVDRRQP